MKFINALAKGKSLSNPIFWKGIQDKINLVSGFVPLIIIIVPQTRSLFTIENIAALSTCVAAMNVYFTNATSDKVGL